jgi:adenosine deaminase
MDRNAGKLWNRFILEMPKVELHLHLEGAFTLGTLFQLVQKYGGDPSVEEPEDLRSRFIYRDFSQFIETWIWKNQFFRSGEDFELSAYETLIGLRKQNILYVEAFYSPWDFEGNGISMEEVTEAVISGCERASRDCGIGWSLIADINREHGPAAGMSRLRQMKEFRHRGVIGIGLGGREKEFPAGPFEGVYREAARTGLFCTAHAGEADGPSSVRAVLERLHVRRIGHGVRAVEDPALVEMLRELQIPLEVCITSNVMTGAVRSLKEHPVRRLFDAGAKITINTDDPAMFGCTLSGEFVLLLHEFGFAPSEIKALCLNAVEATALESDRKAGLINAFETAWAGAPAPGI